MSKGLAANVVCHSELFSFVPCAGGFEEKSLTLKTRKRLAATSLFQKAICFMSKRKCAFGRDALSVRILTDAPIKVQHQKRDQKLPSTGWQLLSLPSGPIWIREAESGELVMTDEPP